MIRSLGLFALLGAVAFSTAAAQDLQRPSWKPVGFLVMKPEAADGAFTDRDRGTRVIARLEVPGNRFVAFDHKKSKVESYTDDKGTDLLAVLAGPITRGPIVIERVGLSGGNPADITFQAPGAPAKGATKVRITGSVVAMVGKDEKEVEKKDVVVKTGVDLDFGTIRPQSRGGIGGAGALASTAIVYQGERAVKSVTLLDADGKEITCRFSSTYRPEAVATKGQHATLITVGARGVERCTIRLKYYDSVEEITVPVDLEVGPGL